MIELPVHDVYDKEGHIDYDKVVEQVNVYIKELLETCLNESFSHANDKKFRQQITETSGRIRDEALDTFFARKDIVASEFYVETESRFYTTHTEIINKQNKDQSRIQAIETGIIEISLAVDNLINKSVERHADIIDELVSRLFELSLHSHHEFNIYCIHPQEFYTNFQHAVSPLKISADGKILICKLLYQQISPKLGNFYSQLNQFLVEMEISPSNYRDRNSTVIDSAIMDPDLMDDDMEDSSIMHMSTGQFYAPIEAESWEEENENSQSEIKSSISRDDNINEGDYSSENNEEVVNDVYGSGQTGLEHHVVALILQPYNLNTRTESSPAQRRQFVKALSTVQRVEAASNAVFQAKQIKTAVRRTLHEKGALDAVEIVENEEKIIDFVSKIFKVILDDDALCDAIKALLAKLQISIIKLALVDFSFFQNPNHPARLLLNRLTSIGVGVTGKEELLFERLKSIVHLITENFETDINVFENGLQEILKLDNANLEQARKAEELAQQKAILNAKRSASKRVVIHTIKKYLKDREIPNQMLEFCLKCWAPHMGMIYRKKSAKSREWRIAVRTLRRIIEVSRGVHSLYDVRQYIKDPREFFKDIRSELGYLAEASEEFNEILEEAETWYLSYIHTIELEAKDLEVINKQEIEHDDQALDTGESSNVIQLFKNLSEPSVPKKADNQSENTHSEKQKEVSSEPKPSKDNETSESKQAPKKKSHTVKSKPAKKDTTSAKPKTEKSSEKPKLPAKPNEITVKDLPKNIVPGTWFEIYQGEDKAKRRLKFSTTLAETNCLLFTDRSGDFILEIDIKTFMDDLDSGRTNLINESNRFDLALSSVISNIRNSQS